MWANAFWGNAFFPVAFWAKLGSDSTAILVRRQLFLRTGSRSGDGEQA